MLTYLLSGMHVAACAEVWAKRRFSCVVQMALLTQAGCILHLMHVLILHLLRTSESLCITVKILNIGIDEEVNSAYLKMDFFIALSVQPGLTSWPFSIILRLIGCSSKCIL